MFWDIDFRPDKLELEIVEVWRVLLDLHIAPLNMGIRLRQQQYRGCTTCSVEGAKLHDVILRS